MDNSLEVVAQDKIVGIILPERSSMITESDYSKWVLEGLHTRGIGLPEVAKMTTLSVPSLKKIQLARMSFTDAQLAAIERATGLTAGQLAVLSMPDADDTLLCIIDALAECRAQKTSIAEHA